MREFGGGLTTTARLVKYEASNKSFDLSRRSEIHIDERVQCGGPVNSVVRRRGMPAHECARFVAWLSTRKHCFRSYAEFQIQMYLLTIYASCYVT